MKIKYYIVNCLSVLLFVSCISKYHFAGSSYIWYGKSQIDSLIFIDRRICIYKQSFVCDSMKYPYKDFNIVCNYRVKKDFIHLKNEYPIDSLKNPIMIPSDAIYFPCFVKGETQYRIYTVNWQTRPVEKNDIEDNLYFRYFTENKMMIVNNLILYYPTLTMIPTKQGGFVFGTQQFIKDGYDEKIKLTEDSIYSIVKTRGYGDRTNFINE